MYASAGPALPVSLDNVEDNENGDDEDCVVDVDEDDDDNELKVDDEDDDADDALPPPPPPLPPPVALVPLLLPAPLIVAIPANFASALGQFGILIAAMNAVPLNCSPLVPVPSGAV